MRKTMSKLLHTSLLTMALCGSLALQAIAQEPPENAAKPETGKPSSPKRLDWERVDRFGEKQAESGQAQAISLGVWFRGKAETRHFGQFAKEDNRRPDDRTIYEIGSVTKVLTAVLLADALERGELAADATIGDLLPAERSSFRPGVAKIRLLSLSTHTSGLPRLQTNMTSLFAPNPYAPIDRAKLISGLSHKFLTLQEKPIHAYSNYGAGLLGQLLADRAGMSYEALLRERIFEPLEMNDSFVEVPVSEQGRFIPPHRGDGQPGHRWPMNAMSPAGGVRSTLADMMKFAKAALEPPDSPVGKAIKRSWKPQRPIGRGEKVAMGWFIKPSFDIHVHDGMTGGYHSLLLVDRKNQYASVTLSNRASFETSRIAKEIRFIDDGN